MNRNQILEKIASNPLGVTDEEMQFLVETEEDLFAELRKLILRIFDINERSLLAESDATSGMMGKFNRISQNYRTKKYFKKIKDPRFNRNSGKHKIIVAEGDSWFQFPVFVKDIIDWLTERNQHYAIYSIAAGGDWLTNMIYDGKYVEQLSIHKPDVFLISGSGNDLVGSSRAALMADKNARFPKYNSINEIKDKLLSVEEKNEILGVQNFITKEFYAFIKTMELQYWKIIDSINRKYPQMKIIIQGYDYAIPSYRHTFDWRYPWKFIVNGVLRSGKWLIEPLRIKGFINPEEQRIIVKTFIFELNFMMMNLVKKFHNVYHVDARGTAKGPNDWFDELHLKSHVFKKVAIAFEHFIELSIPKPSKTGNQDFLGFHPGYRDRTVHVNEIVQKR